MVKNTLLLAASCVLLVKAEGLIDLVRQDSDLSALNSILQKASGGAVNPDIDDRFNAVTARNFTFFAPSNDAISRISPAVLKELGNAQNYPLLLSILRSHFVVGNHQVSTVVSSNASTTLRTVEGSPLVLRPGSSNSAVIDATYYSSLVKTNTPLQGSNGLLYKVDRILDPYISTYGNSEVTTKPTLFDTSPRAENATMTDLVLAEPNLSDWVGMINKVLPAIMKRLGDRRGPEGKDCQTPHPFFVVPSNDALRAVPDEYKRSITAPFEFALASHLLSWGISVPTCATLEQIRKAARTSQGFNIFSHRADLNLTVMEREGVLSVNNARISVANRCAGNGCIWIADRMLDPVYGIF